MSAEEILYDTTAIENEINRLHSYSSKMTHAEKRRLASRRVRHAVKDVLNGVRPRLKGYS